MSIRPHLALDRASANGDAHLTSGTKLRYRKEFTDPSLAAWDVVQGAGMAVAVANSNMTITTGTTALSETTLTSKQAFTPPFKAAIGLNISQKIAGNSFFFELVAVDSDNLTTPDETVVAAWRISGDDSLTSTIARYEVRNGQAARTQSANVTVLTEISAAIYEIVLESDEVSFHNKAVNSTAGKSLSAVMNTVAPDPNRQYKIRIRAVNSAAPPATTTTFTSSFVTALDYTENLVELTGGQGRTDAAGAQAVHVANSPAVSLTSTVIGPSSTITGLTIAKVNSAATTNAAVVKGSAGRLYGYRYHNNTASTKYVRFYNKATSPTVGTDSPAMIVPVPPNGSAYAELTIPVAFATGIGTSITGAGTDLDATAVAVGDVIGHTLYI